jgi:hypothetical protein
MVMMMLPLVGMTFGQGAMPRAMAGARAQCMASPPNNSMARSTDLIKSAIRVMILMTEILTDFEMNQFV